MAFPAIFLNPLGADGLFTVSNLLITSVFPDKEQGLAGGVFNTVAQIGKTVGLAVVALIANQVSLKSEYSDKESPMVRMKGYRASFWFAFALYTLSLFVSIGGLRKIGKVGAKKD